MGKKLWEGKMWALVTTANGQPSGSEGKPILRETQGAAFFVSRDDEKVIPVRVTVELEE